MIKSLHFDFHSIQFSLVGFAVIGDFNNNMYVNLRLDLYVFTYIDTSSLIVSEFEGGEPNG